MKDDYGTGLRRGGLLLAGRCIIHNEEVYDERYDEKP